MISKPSLSFGYDILSVDPEALIGFAFFINVILMTFRRIWLIELVDISFKPYTYFVH